MSKKESVQKRLQKVRPPRVQATDSSTRPGVFNGCS